MKKLIVPILALFVVGACGCWTTGQGEKVGTVIKLSQEGAFITTWEAEVVRGGMNGGSGGFSTTPLHVTIEDTRLLPAFQDAFDKQYEVKISYRQEAVTWWRSECNSGPCRFATAIAPLQGDKK